MTRPQPCPRFVPSFVPTAHRWLAGAALVGGLAGCSSPPSIVQTPTHVPALPPVVQVERAHTGSIFQASTSQAWLFADQYKPRRIGDTLKIDISESLTASNKLDTETSRENKVSSKGPGSGDDSLNGFLAGILNLDATAAGSDSFKGGGKSEKSNQLKGKIGASVINVLANGNLVVAGERQIAFDGNLSTLRFSGVVNPKDIQPGGIVSSTDVVDARFEHVGRGDIRDANSRTWLQKVLTDTLTVW